MPEPKYRYPLKDIFQSCTIESSPKLGRPLVSLKDEDERKWALQDLCVPLLQAAQHPTEHFERLDDALSSLLSCQLGAFKTPTSTPSNPNISLDLVSATEKILSRLPSVPQRLFSLPLRNTVSGNLKQDMWTEIMNGEWAQRYILPVARSSIKLDAPGDDAATMRLFTSLQDVAWDNLVVNVYLDSNTVCLAFKIAIANDHADLELAQAIQEYVNLLAELIDVVDSLINLAKFRGVDALQDPLPTVQALRSLLFPEVDDDQGQGRAILQMFLWAAWQRSVMLYFYYILRVQLALGSNSEWNRMLVIRGLERLSDLSSDDYRGDGIQYMCNWAFELMRLNRSSIGLDFRTQLSRFDKQFGDRPARCLADSDTTCEGSHPESCHRFTDAEAKSQSVHGNSCSGIPTCQRIPWHEISYRQTPSPRAVSTSSRPVGHLLYCQTSANTLAISHVWSHGQGGRPETGINECLHRRYRDLAVQFDCDSYWIDSACIPNDRTLRKEAIGTINEIFYTSKVTLICDQDLQTIQVSEHSLLQYETLFATLLVCDWNVRAWTMLEAVRGSKTIHLLCKNDKTIPLVDLLTEVIQHGRMDLAALLGTAQHLIPSATPNAPSSVEEAGFLLSQRHASKPKDEICIWNLLIGKSGSTDASELWVLEKKVRSAFLMSSVPRVKDVACYGWAPTSPYVRPERRRVQIAETGTDDWQNYSVRYPSYDGHLSFEASITPQGLLGKWLAYDIDPVVIARNRENFCYRENAEDKTSFFEQPDNAHAINLAELLMKNHHKVRVLRPISEDGVTPYLGGKDRGEVYGSLGILCCSKDGNAWSWKGVFQWCDNPWPPFEVQEMLLV